MDQRGEPKWHKVFRFVRAFVLAVASLYGLFLAIYSIPFFANLNADLGVSTTEVDALSVAALPGAIVVSALVVLGILQLNRRGKL